MKLREIVGVLENIAPPRFAEPWDNAGLLAGDRGQEISGVMLAIDCTAAVIEEAEAAGCNLIVAYHPPIFSPLKRLSAGDIAFETIRGIALYSPHTALDAADGGTNDVLADILELKDRAPLRLAAVTASHYKLVIFVPPTHVDAVAQAIFDAGAGHIGDYSHCSFRARGMGTFYGEHGSNPIVGRSGQLERVEEIRLESLIPIGKTAAILAAILRAHPYEEPAFDLQMLAAAPSHGQGRIGTTEPMELPAMLERIRRGLAVEHLLVAGPRERTIHRAAVAAGAGGVFLDDAIAAGADLFLTGELRHHDALKAARAGMTVVCALHSNTERPVLPRLHARLQSYAAMPRAIECAKGDAVLPSPGVPGEGEMPPVRVSQRDRDPFTVL